MGFNEWWEIIKKENFPYSIEGDPIVFAYRTWAKIGWDAALQKSDPKRGCKIPCPSRIEGSGQNE